MIYRFPEFGAEQLAVLPDDFARAWPLQGGYRPVYWREFYPGPDDPDFGLSVLPCLEVLDTAGPQYLLMNQNAFNARYIREEAMNVLPLTIFRRLLAQAPTFGQWRQSYLRERQKREAGAKLARQAVNY